MNILLWILFGGIAGWVASKIMNTDAEQGVVANVVVGILGAFLGGYLMQVFGQDGVDGFNLSSFIVAIIGAVVLLAIFKAFAGKR